jgi:hypothetical protein
MRTVITAFMYGQAVSTICLQEDGDDGQTRQRTLLLVASKLTTYILQPVYTMLVQPIVRSPSDKRADAATSPIRGR